jgi:hypothetical protein
MMLISDAVAVSLISAVSSFLAALLTVINNRLIQKTGRSLRETKDHVAALSESSATTRDYVHRIEENSRRLIFLAGDALWLNRRPKEITAAGELANTAGGTAPVNAP